MVYLFFVISSLSFINEIIAQPIGQSIAFEILEDDSAITLIRTIRVERKNTLRFEKYKVVDLIDSKYFRGFSKVQNCSSCFKKDFPIPGHDYELISVIDTESKSKMNIMVSMAASRFTDAYLGITFKPGNYVITFDKDYDWWKFSPLNEKDKRWFKWKDGQSLGVNITPSNWQNHEVNSIETDSIYTENRFKVYKLSTDTLKKNELGGVYRETNKRDIENQRIAYMAIGDSIEITVKIVEEYKSSYQYISGSSIEQIEDSLYTFRADSSWQFSSVAGRYVGDYFISIISNPEDEELMDSQSKILVDSCSNFNPFSDMKLLSEKIEIEPYFFFKPLVKELFDTFTVISNDSSKISTFQYDTIEPYWWCSKLPIPVPDVSSVSVKLGRLNPIDNLPIELVLNRYWKHSLGFGIADSRNTLENRLLMYIKLLKDGQLQLSYQYPEKGNEYSVIAILKK